MNYVYIDIANIAKHSLTFQSNHGIVFTGSVVKSIVFVRIVTF